MKQHHRPRLQNRLIEQAQAGDKAARDELVETNMRLIQSIVNDYYTDNMRTLTKEDIVQQGVIGLMTAIDKFDVDKGMFSTYATWWVKQSVRRCIDQQDETVRRPIHLIEQGRRLKRWRDLPEDRKYEPEALEKLNLKEEQFEDIDRHMNAVTFSLDLPAGEADSTIADLLPGENDNMYLRNADNEMTHNIIIKALDQLKPKQRNMIIMRYGLDTGEPRTLDEVAEQTGYSRERVRQICTEGRQLLKYDPALKAVALDQILEGS